MPQLRPPGPGPPLHEEHGHGRKEERLAAEDAEICDSEPDVVVQCVGSRKPLLSVLLTSAFEIQDVSCV